MTKRVLRFILSVYVYILNICTRYKINEDVWVRFKMLKMLISYFYNQKEYICFSLIVHKRIHNKYYIRNFYYIIFTNPHFSYARTFNEYGITKKKVRLRANNLQILFIHFLLKENIFMLLTLATTNEKAKKKFFYSFYLVLWYEIRICQFYLIKIRICATCSLLILLLKKKKFWLIFKFLTVILSLIKCILNNL